MTANPYAAAAASAARLAQLTGQPAHDAAVVLGSGWAPAADAMGVPDARIPLAELGGFPPPTVAGHSAIVSSLTIGELRVLVFLGRTHLYEGHPVDTVVHGVRTAKCRDMRTVGESDVIAAWIERQKRRMKVEHFGKRRHERIREQMHPS